MPDSTLTVAAIQMAGALGERKANLCKATTFVEHAALRRHKMVGVIRAGH